MDLSILFSPKTKKILLNNLRKPIDIGIRCMVICEGMNEIVQAKIAQLQSKGWTLAALADELDVTPNAVEKWKSGDRSPSNTKAVLTLLDQLAKRKRIPKKRRYAKGSGNIKLNE
jgi:ribosome-binding protein aMBF1 (putative translation factor)